MQIKQKYLDSIKILKDFINKETKEIYLTGWSDVGKNFNTFHAMLWWYYIEFENCFICIESSQSVGTIQVSIHKNIQCNFDIDESDIFTVSSVNEIDYSGQKIIDYDLIFDKENHDIYAIGIQFYDNKYSHKNHKYAFFNSLSLDGIIFGNERDKEHFLSDQRFYSIKIDEIS